MYQWSKQQTRTICVHGIVPKKIYKNKNLCAWTECLTQVVITQTICVPNTVVELYVCNRWVNRQPVIGIRKHVQSINHFYGPSCGSIRGWWTGHGSISLCVRVCVFFYRRIPSVLKSSTFTPLHKIQHYWNLEFNEARETMGDMFLEISPPLGGNGGFGHYLSTGKKKTIIQIAKLHICHSIKIQEIPIT